MLKQVWAAVDKVPGVCWAVSKLDGSFYFVVYSSADVLKLRDVLPLGGKYLIDVNYSDEDLDRLKKNRIKRPGES